MKAIIFGGEVHQPGKVIKAGYIAIEDGRISEVLDISGFSQSRLEQMIQSENADSVIDATDRIVAAGSIDMHSHGFGGKEFMEPTPEALDTILEAYVQFGVTAVSPTIVTAPEGDIIKALENIGRRYEEEAKGASLLPVHLECRYFKGDTKKIGAHDPKELVNDAERYRQKYNLPNDDRTLTKIILDEVAEFDAASRGVIGIVTIDPELSGALETIKKLRGKGYKVAIGHSNCTIEEAEGAIRNWATILTHSFNCISMEGDYKGDRITTNPNEKNALGTCLDSDGAYAEIVADFVHVGRSYVEMLIKRRGADHTVLVSDASAVAGSNNAECMLGGEEVFVGEKNRNKAAYLKNGKTLCGSVLTMDEAIRNVVDLGFSLNEAFRMASLNAAKALGIEEQRGSIEKGKYADIAVYNRRIDFKEEGVYIHTIGDVECTLVEGKLAYAAPRVKISTTARKAA